MCIDEKCANNVDENINAENVVNEHFRKLTVTRSTQNKNSHQNESNFTTVLKYVKFNIGHCGIGNSARQ